MLWPVWSSNKSILSMRFSFINLHEIEDLTISGKQVWKYACYACFYIDICQIDATNIKSGYQ